MKPLRPSQREKKRYLLIKGKIDEVTSSVFEGIGVLGMSKTGWKIISSKEDKLIVSINREMADSVRACFAIYPKKIFVEKISGTLKGLKS